MKSNLTAPPVQINDEQDYNFQLKPVDLKGNEKPVYGTPKWELTNDEGTTPASVLTASEDGKTAALVSNGAEKVTVTVTVEADPTEGENTLVESCVVTIVAAEDVTPGLTGSAVTKP